jgi:hypothetical protein
MGRRGRLFALALSALVAGCDVAGTVVDRSNNETQLMNMRLSGSGTLKVLYGAAVKEAPLEAIESITLFPEESRTIEGAFCFAADIRMKDGTRIFGKNKTGDGNPAVFVAVNQTLTGTSHRGLFSIDLSGVSKITFR